MTENKRYSVPVPPELEQRIINLRKTDEFCTMTFAEIIRHLMRLGLEQVKVEN